MKIRPIGAELFHADGQTDGNAKLTVVVRNSANAPNQTEVYLRCSLVVTQI